MTTPLADDRAARLSLDGSTAARRPKRALEVKADPTKANVPSVHPLRFWKIEEAAERTGLSEETLRNSDCPRAHVGRCLLFDPVETVGWVRLHLSHVVSCEAPR